ncbi:MAG: hypothetical protein ABJA78_19320 [Ferruginibacter sp.]
MKKIITLVSFMSVFGACSQENNSVVKPVEVVAKNIFVADPTIYYSKGFLVLDKVSGGRSADSSGDFKLTASISVSTKDSSHYKVAPSITGNANTTNMENVDDTLYAQNLFIRFAGINADKKFRIAVKETDKLIDFIAVKAYIFPYINLVWFGLVLMAIGFVISIIRRAGFSSPAAAIVLLAVAAGLCYMFLFAD